MAANCTGSDSLRLSNKFKPAEDLWEKALQRLDSPDFASLQSHTTEKRQTLEEVLRIVRQKEQICKEKRWKWKNGKGNVIIVRDIFAKMVAWIERFKAVGDTVVQYDPGHAALPWAAVRFVLQVAVNDVRNFGAMAEGLETIVQLIVRYDVVERLYLQGNSTLVEQLRSRIEGLYASVLVYLLDANRYYSRNTTGRIASSILHVSGVRVDELLNEIKYKQDEIDRYLSLVSDQMLNNVHQMILNQDRDNLKIILESLCAPVPRIASQLSTIEDHFKQEERHQVFEWLSSIPYTKHHRSKTRALLPGSGYWLLKKPEFIEWIESSSSSVLWLHGIPGSGKSMLVAHVVEYIQNQTPSCCESASIAYFYCARNANEPERADPEEVLRSIVEQLSSSDEEMPIREPVAKVYRAKKKESKGRKPEKLSLEESVDIIVDLLKTNPGTIIIDGLDECEPTLRQGLLDALAAIIKESDNVVKIFVSSRDDHDLVYRLSETPNLYIQATDNAVDIRRFVLTRVDEAISKGRILCGRVSNSLRDIVTSTLIQKAEGMFRLVSLHIDTLCNPHLIKTEANVWYALEHLPRDLKNSYQSVMLQISNSEEPNPKIAERVMKLLLCAQPMLDSQSLLLAVSTEIAPIELNHLDILSICCNLVVYDVETDKFRFAHLSVQEYLSSLGAFSVAASNAAAAEMLLRWFDSSARKETCLADELQIYKTARQDDTTNRKIMARSLDLYARIHWIGHVQLSDSFRKLEPLCSLLQRFLLGAELGPRVCKSDFFYGRAENTVWMPLGSRVYLGGLVESIGLPEHWKKSFMTSAKKKKKKQLFLVCTFGLWEIVDKILEKAFDLWELITMKNSTGLNCAQIVAHFDQIEVLEVILARSQFSRPEVEGGQNGFDVNRYWRGALLEAALGGNTRTVQRLLKRGGDSDDGFSNNFMKQGDIAAILRLRQWYHIREDVWTIVFTQNRQIVATEAVLVQAFKITLGGEDILRQLLEYTAHVEITSLLASVLVENEICGDKILFVLLGASKSLHINEQALSLISTFRLTAGERSWHLLSTKTARYKVSLADIINLPCRPRQTPQYYVGGLILTTEKCDAYSGHLSLDKAPNTSRIIANEVQTNVLLGLQLLVNLLDKPLQRGREAIDTMITVICKDNLWPGEVNYLVNLLFIWFKQRFRENLEVAEEHARLATISGTAEETVFALVKGKAEVLPSAIKIMISQWDIVMVERLLNLTTIAITDEVIAAAARNKAYGSDIIRLLLEKENEELEKEENVVD